MPFVFIFLIALAGGVYFVVRSAAWAQGSGNEQQGWFGRVATNATRIVRGRTNPAAIEYFNAGLENWVSATVHRAGPAVGFGAGDWSCDVRGAEPGALRIWKESLDLRDCDIEFLGRINVRSIGVAFRAINATTFTGIKIIVAPRGSGAPAHIEHFVQLNGTTVFQSISPLTGRLEEGTEFNALVKLRGAKVITTIDGTTSDVWTDHRLRPGGIGFFDEPDASSTIHWVKITERDSLVGRADALFSFVRTSGP